MFLLLKDSIYSVNLCGPDLLRKVVSWNSPPWLDEKSNWTFIPPSRLLRHTEPIEFLIKGGPSFELLQLDPHLKTSLPLCSLSSKLPCWKSLLHIASFKSPLESFPFAQTAREMVRKIEHSVEQQARLLANMLEQKSSVQSLLEIFKFWRADVFPLLVDVGETLHNRSTIVKQEYERQSLILDSICTKKGALNLRDRITSICSGLFELKKRMDSIVALSLTDNVDSKDRFLNASQSLSRDFIVQYQAKYEELESKLCRLSGLLHQKITSLHVKEQRDVPLHILFDELGLSERYLFGNFNGHL